MDMKKASYEGTTAHSGEYEGELVEREAQRVKNIADKFILENNSQYHVLGFKKEKKTGFWKKVLNFLLP
jgi:hypothetical protein